MFVILLVSLTQTLPECSTPLVCGLRCTDNLLVSGEGSALRLWKKSEATTSNGDDDGLWSSHCFLNAGNGRNIKDFLILDEKGGNFIVACDFEGDVYVWNTISRQKRVTV